jgi:TRAP-type C4-dicarboxylate transport system permease small subunit
VARSTDPETATLLDRVALALLSGLWALALAALVWGGIAMVLAQLRFEGLPPLWPVLAFASSMALVGFLALENLVGNLVGSLVGSVLRWLGWLTP